MAKISLNQKVSPKITPIPKKVVDRFLQAVEDLLEYLEYSRPEFWEEIEKSRKSGRISGKKVKKELGI